MAQSQGWSGCVFSDFGDEFEVVDTTGEQPLDAAVASISHDESGLVNIYGNERHGLQEGDKVAFIHYTQN